MANAKKWPRRIAPINKTHAEKWLQWIISLLWGFGVSPCSSFMRRHSLCQTYSRNLYKALGSIAKLEFEASMGLTIIKTIYVSLNFTLEILYFIQEFVLAKLEHFKQYNPGATSRIYCTAYLYMLKLIVKLYFHTLLNEFCLWIVLNCSDPKVSNKCYDNINR